jgi:hypothetical protein
MNVLVGLGCFVAYMVVVFRLALRFGLLGNVLHAGGGVLSLPLLFSFQSVVLLLLLLVAGCAFIESFRTHTSQGPLLYLMCVALASAPAAFSRADIGHIFINTLGAVVAALVILSQYPAAWRWTWPAFILLIVLSTYGKYTWCREIIRTQVLTTVYSGQYPSPRLAKLYTAIYKRTHRNAQARLDERRAAFSSDPDANAPQLPPQTHLFAPFGVQRRITPPADGIQIVTGRYDGFFPLTLASAIPEKIAEIEAHPDWPLLLPPQVPLNCVMDPNKERSTLRSFLLTPYIPPPRHTVSMGKSFCDYLNAHYVVSSYASPDLGLAVWVRKVAGPG